MDGLEGARNPWLDGNYKAVDGSCDLLIVGGEKERGRKTFWWKMAPSWWHQWCSRIKSLLGIRTWVWITHGGRSTVGCKGWRSTNHNKVWSGLDDSETGLGQGRLLGSKFWLIWICSGDLWPCRASWREWVSRDMTPQQVLARVLIEMTTFDPSRTEQIILVRENKCSSFHSHNHIFRKNPFLATLPVTVVWEAALYI